jgi:hypothetical protein
LSSSFSGLFLWLVSPWRLMDTSTRDSEKWFTKCYDKD